MRNLHRRRPQGAILRSPDHPLGLPALHQGHKFIIGNQIFWLPMTLPSLPMAVRSTRSIRLATKCHPLWSGSLLLRYSANLPVSAATKRGRVIGMVVPPGMNHQRTSLEIGNLQTWRKHRLGSISIGIHEERGKIAQVPITPGGTVSI